MANNTGQGLLELADLISRREYNWGIVRSRVYEEELVHNYADETDTEFTTLADTIDELWKKGVIDDKSRENLHNIRILGNKAVHEGDNDPQDAKNAYFMLKEELQTFADRGNVETDRTPVMINTGNRGAEITEGEVYVRPSQKNRENTQDESEDIDMSYATNRRKPTGNQRPSGNVKKKKKKSSGFDLYSVLKILIPVLIVVLLIILIKSLFPKKDPAVETQPTTVSSEVETTKEEETEKETEETTTPAPTTEAPTTSAPAKYQISGEGVNIRLADNPDTVYTQLSKGTVIGEVSDYSSDNEKYSDFAKFRYDGKDVIVSKKYIEKAND